MDFLAENSKILRRMENPFKSQSCWGFSGFFRSSNQIFQALVICSPSKSKRVKFLRKTSPHPTFLVERGAVIIIGLVNLVDSSSWKLSSLEAGATSCSKTMHWYTRYTLSLDVLDHGGPVGLHKVCRRPRLGLLLLGPQERPREVPAKEQFLVEDILLEMSSSSRRCASLPPHLRSNIL